MPRVALFSATFLVLGLVLGMLVQIGAPGLAQEASPVAEVAAGETARLGGDLPGDPQVQLIKVAEGFNDPVNIAFPNDGSGRIFVLERAGLIRVVEPDGTLLEEPFLDLSRQVTVRGSGEQGLLGLAFHPNYAENGRFYVDYNSQTGNNDVFITEFRVSQDNPNKADPESERLLMRLERPFATHSGGTIKFDKDGYLFIGIGDGGESGDPYDNAQNRFSMLGKILRIDVDGGGPGRPYGIPPDNPFIGPDRADNPFPGTRPEDAERRGRGERSIGHMGPDSRKFRSQVPPEIWALGLRQPWSYSIDPETGDVFIGDVGARAWEEINYWPGGTAAGQNYGWDWLEGSHCYPETVSECPRQQVGVLPAAEYAHDTEGCAVIALGVYRGDDAPDLDGVFLNADYCNGKIRGLARDDSGRWVFQDLLDTALLITAGNQDETGAIYVSGRTIAGPSDEEGGKPQRSKEGADTLWRLVPADQVPEGSETVPLGETGIEGAMADDAGGEPAQGADTGEGQADAAAEPGQEDDAQPEETSALAEEEAMTSGTPASEREGRGGGRTSDEVTIESYDIFFEPNRAVVPADTDVLVTLPNVGATLHNFSIDELDISIDIEPGATEETTINAPAGRYDFYCNVPGHLEAGMAGTLVVR